jgi:hypothetical protein
VLVQHCFKCHSNDAPNVEGGLLLDSRDAARRGGDSGAAVVPGDAKSSLLLKALRHEGPEMPPEEKLPDDVIRDFEQWISSGAVDPRDTSPAPTEKSKIDFTAARQFWSFQTPTEHEPAPIKDAAKHGGWPRRRIDSFLLSAMESAGLEPNPLADPRTLLRRASFDLTGLPPTAEEVEAFVADPSQQAYEQAVDRLLASPQYGERLARLWLDVARFAEDQAHIVGDDRSLCYPNAYRYRDWVIRALNEDMPFTQFVRMQLAADLYEPENVDAQVALGFLGLGPKYYDRGSLAVKSDEWEDRVDIVGRGLLGLTVACARCHDHKFDPIGTEDYYALAGVFASTDMYNRPLDSTAEVNDRGQAKKPNQAMHIVRDAQPQDLNIFVRGNVENKGAVALRHFPRVLCTDEPPHFAQGSGRRELAEAIVSEQNPLTARVIVNRIWALTFGRPLVSTPSNFGTRGERPTHPELLDDLAVRFMKNGWSLKWLERELVLSAAYRQGSVADAAKLAADPENRWLARMNRRRLSVEEWRDALLAVTSRLDRQVGGPSIDPLDPEQKRRTIYSGVSRLELNRMLALFDYPDPNLHADRRLETTSPLQKLFVMNSPYMIRQADGLAEQVLAEPAVATGANGAAADPTTIEVVRIRSAYRRVFGRTPSDTELQLAMRYLTGSDATGDAGQRWKQYAQALLASNEFLFLD